MKYLFIAILTCFAVVSKSQIYKSEKFNKFIDCFRSSFKEIPKELFYEICDEEENDRLVGVDAVKILNDESNITVLVDLVYPEGGYTSMVMIYTFSNSGELLERTALGNNMLDLSGGDQCEFEMKSKNLLEVVQKNIVYEGVDYEIERVADSTYKYYFIDENGFDVILSRITQKRKYILPSLKVFNSKELYQYEESELDIMRNEIFADHGYIFKSKKWSDYFSKIAWYQPRFDDVSDKLTEIEKINIKRILEVSKRK
ncbi:hypothetical protein DF185_20335 [Marinifilum breve]|uniref:YARHG domain-containing protein n=1 Tax=Marinifilum breve TaxID=2184082 RepID=A0A2V3ZS86_9BACT|nr:YARHG domain-containing protein [Marinifilum breve]PXX96133.1 hypothetical protein DF185_20335 [Marinifilum breve]